MESTDSSDGSGERTCPFGGADTATALDAYRALFPGAGADTVYVNVGTGVQVVRSEPLRRPRMNPTERIFADTSGHWYAMQAWQRDAGDDAVVIDRIVDAVTMLAGRDIVVGGGAALDSGFRHALAARFQGPVAYARPRSLSASGAAIVAARGMGHRIGLRQGLVAGTAEVEGDGR